MKVSPYHTFYVAMWIVCENIFVTLLKLPFLRKFCDVKISWYTVHVHYICNHKIQSPRPLVKRGSSLCIVGVVWVLFTDCLQNFIVTYIKAGMYMYVHEEHLYLNLLSLPFFFIPSFPSLPSSLSLGLFLSPSSLYQISFSGCHYFIKANAKPRLQAPP